MRILYLFLALFCFAKGFQAQEAKFPQNLSGDWYGLLDLSNTQIRLEFTFNTDGTGVMRSPDQQDGETPLSYLSQEQNQLKFGIESIDFGVEATIVSPELLAGIISQYGMKYNIELTRTPQEVVVKSFPQTPKAPFPYSSRALTIKNTPANVSLAGTLTFGLEDNKTTPIVIMITGSGPQNRNEEIMGHQAFWVIADHLARQNIASFRFDDRGVGESTGNFSTATSEDFASDVKSIVAYFKNSEAHANRPIGLLGHSEGGLIAAMVAAANPDIDFVVSLAGPGIDGMKILEKQNKAMMIAEGMREESAQKQADFVMSMANIVVQEKDSIAARNAIKTFLEVHAEPGVIMNLGGIDQALKTYNSALNSAWMRFFLNHDPAEDWKRVTCPVLALNGTVDTQVEAAANLNAIEFALRRAGNKQYKIVALKQHNHLFQPSITGALSEYGKIEITISDLSLESISTWINQL